MTPGTSAPNLYIPFAVEVVLVTRETADTMTFRCEGVDGARIDYAPGQFLILSILGVGECPISIASSPTDGPWVELTVRDVGRVTGALHHGPPRGSLGLRGPFGTGFDIERLRSKSIILAAGGIGLAPLRSIIRYIHARRDEFGPLTILYGSRTPGDRLYSEELDAWNREPGTRVLQAVESDPACTWPGRVGRLPLLFDLVTAGDGTAAVICGPPPMVSAAVAPLEGMGVDPADIQVAVEGRMNCGVGKCGHCYMGEILVCTHGPVFTARRLRSLGVL